MAKLHGVMFDGTVETRCPSGRARTTLELRRGYLIIEGGTQTGATSITCFTCGRTSYHPDDVRQRFCGHCHVFHEDPR
jgi:hypothetical protein